MLLALLVSPCSHIKCRHYRLPSYAHLWAKASKLHWLRHVFLLTCAHINIRSAESVDMIFSFIPGTVPASSDLPSENQVSIQLPDSNPQRGENLCAP